MSQLRDDPEAYAAEMKLEVVYPKDDEVFVDLDSQDAKARFLLLFDKLIMVWDSATVLFTNSKTAGHWHAYVKIPQLKPITVQERTALQAALGSDSMREFLAVKRVRLGEERSKNPSLFFEDPNNFRWQCLKAIRDGVQGDAVVDSINMEMEVPVEF